jgi:hypothetical protein
VDRALESKTAQSFSPHSASAVLRAALRHWRLRYSDATGKKPTAAGHDGDFSPVYRARPDLTKHVRSWGLLLRVFLGSSKKYQLHPRSYPQFFEDVE